MSITEQKHSKEQLVVISGEIARHDTRMSRCRIHDAQTIVFVTLCAVLCGYTSWDEIAEYGRCRKSLIEEYLGPLASMPSHDTISRFFSLLKPTAFEGEYRKWVEMVFCRRSNPSEKKDVLAFDGKEIIGARESDGTPLRVLSAFSTECGISLGQKVIGGKSNEIPAMQELLREIDIRDTVVTADALNCQRDTCRTILEEGGDYFLFVKSNQKSLMDAVRKGVDGAVAHPRSNNQKVSIRHEGHGRVTYRTCVAVGERLYLGSINDKWAGVKSFGSVTTEGTRRATQTRYFITSLPMDAERFLEVARSHWGVENGLHWRLDVDFHEDDTRKKRNAAKNFSLICKMAIAILSLDKTKLPMSRKKQKMALNEQYFREMMEKVSKKKEL